MIHRFTIDGSDALELHLASICRRVLDGVLEVVPREQLEGILLGGGYGRGEGGVLRNEEEEKPYNDIEFYVLIRGNRWINERRYAEKLHALANKLTPEALVEVEFKITSRRALQNSRITMFYYDLVMGHFKLEGDDHLLDGCEHHHDSTSIPLFEATRLLMNRCSGLLFAQERLERSNFTMDDADFVRRNLAKAELAFGDVVLAANGEYHWSCRKRSQRLEKLRPGINCPWLGAVKKFHRRGVDFKLNPWRSYDSVDELKSLHCELRELGSHLWLWLENRRLGATFASTRDYALSEMDKCPETPLWRNLLINLRTFGPSALISPQAARYPRERLFHSLVLMLWEPGVMSNLHLLRRIQKELRSDARTFLELASAYEVLWRRFN